jgi:hypothetical protein
VRRAGGAGGAGQPGARAAGRDFVTYWPGFAAEPHDPVPSAWWVRRFTGAFLDGTGVVALWQETAPAAVRAAGRADPDGHVTTQGHVLAIPDFLATLATEAGPASGPQRSTCSREPAAHPSPRVTATRWARRPSASRYCPDRAVENIEWADVLARREVVPAVDRLSLFYGVAAGATVTLVVLVAFRAALFPQDTR